MLINFSNNNFISYDSRINFRLINYRYKLRAETQINFLIKKHLRIHIHQEMIKNLGKDFSKNPFKKSFIINIVKVYHVEGQKNTPLNDQENYQHYKNAFYQNAFAKNFDEINFTAKYYDEQNDKYQNDFIKIHFIIQSPLKQSIKYQICKNIFISNNKLHKHLIEYQKPLTNNFIIITKSFINNVLIIKSVKFVINITTIIIIIDAFSI